MDIRSFFGKKPGGGSTSSPAAPLSKSSSTASNASTAATDKPKVASKAQTQSPAPAKAVVTASKPAVSKADSKQGASTAAAPGKATSSRSSPTKAKSTAKVPDKSPYFAEDSDEDTAAAAQGVTPMAVDDEPTRRESSPRKAKTVARKRIALDSDEEKDDAFETPVPSESTKAAVKGSKAPKSAHADDESKAKHPAKKRRAVVDDDEEEEEYVPESAPAAKKSTPTRKRKTPTVADAPPDSTKESSTVTSGKSAKKTSPKKAKLDLKSSESSSSAPSGVKHKPSSVEVVDLGTDDDAPPASSAKRAPPASAKDITKAAPTAAVKAAPVVPSKLAAAAAAAAAAAKKDVKVINPLDFFGAAPTPKSKPAPTVSSEPDRRPVSDDEDGTDQPAAAAAAGDDDDLYEVTPSAKPGAPLKRTKTDEEIAREFQAAEDQLAAEARDRRLAQALQEEEQTNAFLKRAAPAASPIKKEKEKTATPSSSKSTTASSTTSPKKRKLAATNDGDSADEVDDDFTDKKKAKAPAAVSKPSPKKKPTKKEAAAAKKPKMEVQLKTAAERKADRDAAHAKEEAEAAEMQAAEAGKKKGKGTPAKAAAAPAGGSPEEPKKKFNFYAFKNAPRPTPPNLGKKDIPEGAENCLGGLTFVMTGVLDSLEREDATDLIKKYGGKVTGSISGKTSYLLVGLDASEGKQAKAKEKGAKIISEDDLLELIRTRKSQPIKEVKAPKGASKAAAAAAIPLKASAAGSTAASGSASAPSAPMTFGKKPMSFGSAAASAAAKSGSSKPGGASGGGLQAPPNSEGHLWVDKYKPTRIADLVGNLAPAQRLATWLNTWNDTYLKGKGNIKTKAALISGAPGIGKTTAALVVSKLNGFDVIERNASVTRNKTSMASEVLSLVGSQSVEAMFTSNTAGLKKGQHPAVGKKVLIMDEVDGIAGNEDRGGLAALIDVIKKSKIPIICICNDGSNPKMRTLKNYCMQLVFARPRVESMIPRIMQICEAEGVKADRVGVERLCQSVRQDFRQALNTLQVWATTAKSLSLDDIKNKLQSTGKDFDHGPFEVCRDFFRAPPTRVAAPISKPGDDKKYLDAHVSWIDERIDKYFVDMDLMPLFIQDMYLGSRPLVTPGGDPTQKGMDITAEAADAVADGDLLQRKIMSQQQFSLLPAHAVISTILPGVLMGGGGAMPTFPSWLGKNSNQNKHYRQLTEAKINMSVTTGGATARAIALEYLPMLREKLVRPLLENDQDGIDEVIDEMDAYGLTREDWTTLTEELGGSFSLVHTKDIPTATKSAFTRKYNQRAHLVKAARGKKKVKGAKAEGGMSGVINPDAPVDEDDGGDEADAGAGDDEEADGGAGAGDVDEEDVQNDKMVVMKKAPAAGGRKRAAAGSAGAGTKGKKGQASAAAGKGAAAASSAKKKAAKSAKAVDESEDEGFEDVDM